MWGNANKEDVNRLAQVRNQDSSESLSSAVRKVAFNLTQARKSESNLLFIPTPILDNNNQRYRLKKANMPLVKHQSCISHGKRIYAGNRLHLHPCIHPRHLVFLDWTKVSIA